MEAEKVESLLKWVSILVEQNDSIGFDTFSDGVILLELLKLIDKDAWTEEYDQDASGRVECILTYLQGLYGDIRAIVNKTAILAGDEFEIVKLLTVILVCAVNSDNVHRFVGPILALPKSVQMNVMSIIEPINERNSDSNLNDLLQEVLCNPVTEKESHFVRSPSSYICSPGFGGPLSPYPSFVGSPAISHLRNNSHSSSIGADSPFRFIPSPHFVNKKELFEKNKLNVKIRRLLSSVTTQNHVIDDLEHRLAETSKKNEMLETINADFKQRLKILSVLQEEVDSLKLNEIESKSKQLDFGRIKQQLTNVLNENTSLKEELMILKSSYEDQDKMIKQFQSMKENQEKSIARQHELEMTCAKLTSGLELREEELRRVSSEKDEKLREISEYAKFLQEKMECLEDAKNKEDSFVLIGQEPKSLGNELLVVQLEDNLNKAKEEINTYKEKYEDSSKVIFELKKELNNESKIAKEREENLTVKLTSLKSLKDEVEAKLSSFRDENHSLKAEKEQILMKYDHQVDVMERSIQDALMKAKSTELELAKMNYVKDELEKTCRDQATENAKQIKKIEETHQVECYKLKGTYDKQISELKQLQADKTLEYDKVVKNYQHLHKSKRSDDEIYMTRISALVQEREIAVQALKTEMEEKINCILTERNSMQTEKDSLTEEMKTLKVFHIEEMKNLIESNDGKVANLEAELTALTADNEILKNTNKLIPELEENNSRLRLTVEERLKEIKKLCQENISIKTARMTLEMEMKREIESLKQQHVDELLKNAGKLKEMERCLDIEKQTHEENTKASEIERGNLKKCIDASAADLMATHQKIAKLEEDLLNEKQGKELGVEELKKIKIDLALEKDQVSLLTECEKSLKMEIEDLKVSLEENAYNSKMQSEELVQTKNSLMAEIEKVVKLTECEKTLRQEIEDKNVKLEGQEHNIKLQSEELEEVKNNLVEQIENVAKLTECGKTLRMEIEDNNVKLEGQEHKIKLQSEELEEIKNNLVEQKENVAKLTECEKTLRMEIEDKNVNLEDQEHSIQLQREELEEVKNNLVEQIENVAKLTECEKTLRMEIEDKNVKLEGQEHKIKLQSEELEEIKNSLVEQIGNVAKLTEYEKTLRQEIEDKNVKLEGQEHKIKLQSEELEEVKNNLVEQKENVVKLTEYEKTLRMEIEDNNVELEGQEDNIKLQSEELEEVKNNLVEQIENVAKLTEYEKTFRQEIEDKNVKLEDQEHSIKLQREELEEVKNNLVEQTENVTKLTECEKTLRQEIEEKNVKLEGQEHNIKLQSEELEEIKNNLVEQIENVAKLTECEKTFKQEIEDKNVKLEDQEHSIKLQREELEEVKNNLVEQTENVAKLTEYEKTLRMEIEDKNVKLEDHEHNIKLQSEELEEVKNNLVEQIENVAKLTECEKTLRQEIEDKNVILEDQEHNIQLQREELEEVKNNLVEQTENVAKLTECEKTLRQEIEDKRINFEKQENNIELQSKELEQLKTTLASEEKKSTEASEELTKFDILVQAKYCNETRLEKELELARASLRKSNEKKCEVQLQLNVEKAEILTLQQKNSKLIDNNTHANLVANAQITDLEMEIEKLKCFSKTEQANLQKCLEDEQTKVESCKEELESIKAEYEQNTTALLKRLDVVETENCEFKNELKEKSLQLHSEIRLMLESKADCDAERIESLKREDKLVNELHEAKKEIDLFTKQLTDSMVVLEQERKSTCEYKEETASILEVNRNEIAVLTEKKETLKEENHKIAHKLTAAEKLVEARDLKISECKNELDFTKSAFQTEKEDWAIRVKSLEGERSRLKEELNVIIVEKENAKEIAVKKEIEVEEIEKKFMSTKEENQLLENELAEVRKCLELEKEVVHTKEECAIKTSKRLHDLLKESQMEMEVIREQNDVAKECAEQRQKELEEGRQELEKLRASSVDKDERLSQTQDLLKEAENDLRLHKEQTKAKYEAIKATKRKENLQLLRDIEEKDEELKIWKKKFEKTETKLLSAENEMKKLFDELEEEKLISRRHGSLLRSKEVELAKSTQSLDDVKEQLGKHEKEVERKEYRRRTILFGDITDQTLNATSDFSFDEQSTIVADEVTLKRSPSLKSLDMKCEETFGGSITSLDSNDVSFARSRSIRRQSGIRGASSRRQSLLYISGKTPPDRRTTLGAPIPRLPICHMEDEPDILEFKDFNSGFDRMSELNRRNTLCLPHLKSSYPLELIQDNDRTLQNNDRTLQNNDRTFQNSDRTFQDSDRTFQNRAMIDQNGLKIKEQSFAADIAVDPRRQSVAFQVSFHDDKKKLKPNASMRRACGSAHLLPGESTESLNGSKKIVTKRLDSSRKGNAANNPRSIEKAPPLKRSKTENVAESRRNAEKSTPLKRSTSDKTSLKSRTNNLRKSIRRSITSKVRGAKSGL